MGSMNLLQLNIITCKIEQWHEERNLFIVT